MILELCGVTEKRVKHVLKIAGPLIHVILSLWNTQNEIKNIIILKVMILGIEPFMYILHKLHVYVYMDDLNKSRKCL